MKIAIPTANGKLAMHFGHCELFALIDVNKEEKKICSIETATPPAHEPGVLPRWLHELGAAVIIAGGFGELGGEGKKLESHMVETAQKNNIRLIGPNTSGMINLKESFNLVGLKDAPRGDIALLTQSGNMALTLITEDGA